MRRFDPRPQGLWLPRCFERLMGEQGVEWVREDPSTDGGDQLASIVMMGRPFTMRFPSGNVHLKGFWWEVTADRWRATFHTVLPSPAEKIINDFVFSGSEQQFEQDMVLLRLALPW